MYYTCTFKTHMTYITCVGNYNPCLNYEAIIAVSCCNRKVFRLFTKYATVVLSYLLNLNVYTVSFCETKYAIVFEQLCVKCIQ